MKGPGTWAGLTSPGPQNPMEPKKPTEGTLAGPTNLGNPADPTNPAVGNPAGRRSCIARSVDNQHLERRATTKPTAPAQPAKGPARAHRTEAVPGERQIAPEVARSQNPPAPKRTSAAHRQIQFAASRGREAPNLTPSRPTELRRHSERSRSPRGPGPRPGRFALRGRKAARLRRGRRAQSSPGQTSGVKTLARRRP